MPSEIYKTLIIKIDIKTSSIRSPASDLSEKHGCRPNYEECCAYKLAMIDRVKLPARLQIRYSDTLYNNSNFTITFHRSIDVLEFSHITSMRLELALR